VSDTPKKYAPDPEAIIDALAPLLGIDVTPEFRPGVIANLETTIRLARVVLAAPLDEREEPAAVFRP
jgi:hypothetical protein